MIDPYWLTSKSQKDERLQVLFITPLYAKCHNYDLLPGDSVRGLGEFVVCTTCVPTLSRLFKEMHQKIYLLNILWSNCVGRRAYQSTVKPMFVIGARSHMILVAHGSHRRVETLLVPPIGSDRRLPID
jgi:hypothetical protein